MFQQGSAREGVLGDRMLGELTPGIALMHYPLKGCEGDEYPCRSVTREGGREGQRTVARGARPLIGQRAGACELTGWKPPVRSMGNTTPEPPVEIEQMRRLRRAAARL